MAEDLGEKTEKATPRRREEAIERGSMPKSTDLSGALVLTGAMLLLLVFAPYMQLQFAGMMRLMLAGELNINQLSTEDVMYEFGLMFWAVIRTAGPLLGLMMVVGYLSYVIQVGFRLSAKPLEPKLSSMDPIKGVKRLFSLRSLVKAGASVFKVAFMLIVAVAFVSFRFREILTLGYRESNEAVIIACRLFMQLCFLLLLALILLGLIDFIYQKWQWERDNRMTKHEVKEERKMVMGDEKVKHRQRNIARNIMMQRMQQMVPQADVIVTNPEHLAIAIKWDPDSMNAPKVLAKGADHVALRIRQIALAHRVPVLERKPLARAMYPLVRVGQEIPSQFYQAVAEVLAYVYRLQGRKVG